MTRSSNNAAGQPSGQGMMELLIAIAVIMVGIIGTITLALTSVRLAREGRIRVVAANLGREGIEIVRMLRDSNWLAGDPWQNGLDGGLNDYSLIPEFESDPAEADYGWTLNFDPNGLDEDATKVYRVGATYMQEGGYAGEGKTIYRRIVNANPICASPVAGCTGGAPVGTICYDGEGDCTGSMQIGVQVISTVRSTYHSIVHELTLEERLYDWR